MDEWLAYTQIEPWGEERADWRAALIACMLANIHRDEKRKTEPYEISDFMPDFSGEAKTAKEQTPEEMYTAFKALTKSKEPNDGD